MALESSVSAAHPDIRNLSDGAAISLQYEPAKAGQDRLKLHQIRLRLDGEKMDAAPELIGVIDNVNNEKSVIHVIVSREIDKVVPLADFSGEMPIGDKLSGVERGGWKSANFNPILKVKELNLLRPCTDQRKVV